ncbi:FG-GAP-like repeat-containing protein [Paenibacillus silagei]|uniref:YD repeat-containing protein n=1 Tax=Paenibacillus silagei TaxID=1670801 RepID=A0ABS4NZT9_9BACL|nr:FG-GAP-like repeat-containing protein [Paenibacillus silagei]MBP2114954.1 YD repeat-containing protein [Paenibacillus silagei]
MMSEEVNQLKKGLKTNMNFKKYKNFFLAIITILCSSSISTISSAAGTTNLNKHIGYHPWSWSTTSRMIDDNSQMWFEDVNGDGKKDLISKGEAGAWNAGVVYVALSTGTGFQPWTWNSGTRMIDDHSSMWFADVNGDGKADLITKGEPGAWNAGVVYVSLSTGNGYQPWTWNSGIRMLDDHSPLWIEDVNGDGRADLISVGQAGAWNEGYIYVSLSTGSGYQPWTWTSSIKMLNPLDTACFADVNGDGKADLIAKGHPGAINAGQMYVSLSTGSGYNPWTWTSGVRMVNDNDVQWFADVNGDGKADMISKGQPGTANAGYVFVSLSNGAGYAYWTWNSGKRMIDDSGTMWFTDINGDGKADMISVGKNVGYNDGWLYASLSTGSGYPYWTWNSGSRMIDSDDLWFSDVSGDGRGDLIIKGSGREAGFVRVAVSTDFNQLQHEYNAAGQLLRTILPDGSTIQYTYDKNGNLLKVEKK